MTFCCFETFETDILIFMRSVIKIVSYTFGFRMNVLMLWNEYLQFTILFIKKATATLGWETMIKPQH